MTIGEGKQLRIRECLSLGCQPGNMCPSGTARFFFLCPAVSRKFYVHSGASEQFIKPDEKQSIFRRELKKKNDWSKEAAL